MSQTKIAYYADLFIYPIIVAGFMLFDIQTSGFILRARWWCAFFFGIVLWTLAEYLLHRFVYHDMPFAKELHARHHTRPTDFIGSPLWISLLGFSAFLLILSQFWKFEMASGTTCGLIVGYVWYLVIHDAVHRWRMDEKSWMRRMRLRHLRHHRSPTPGNFGVTTGVWDFVFATPIAPPIRDHRPSEQRIPLA
jgi:sterol desaturase/sphingolipid hydroxylase (fatty acid hydroxylase superfamily)